MADIAVITGVSSGLGVKFLEAVVNRYPQMDEYWILARRKERLDKLVGKYGYRNESERTGTAKPENQSASVFGYVRNHS